MMELMHHSVHLDSHSSINQQLKRRSFPISHPPAPLPLCKRCATYDYAFFDFDCSFCRLILTDLHTSISQIFAIIRQLTPQIQNQLEFLIYEIFKRGANANDRDGLTSLSMLHFAAKAGAQANSEMVSRVVKFLINEGADIEARCRWTDMTPLHYSVYFNVPIVVEALIDEGADIEAVCNDSASTGDSALHIAASQLSVEAAISLIDRGANPFQSNSQGKLPYDCLPSAQHLDSVLLNLQQDLATLLDVRQHHSNNSDADSLDEDFESVNVSKIKLAMQNINSPVCGSNHIDSSPYSKTLPDDFATTTDQCNNNNLVGTRPQKLSSPLQSAIGLTLGERVCVYPYSNSSSVSWPGWLRYCGSVEFAAGVWAGVELDESAPGRNNGTVTGVMYFTCPPERGVFAPIAKVTRIADDSEICAPLPKIRSSVEKNIPSLNCSTDSESNESAIDSNSGNTTRTFSRTAMLSSLVSGLGPIDVSHVKARIDTGLRQTYNPNAFYVGCRVLVAGHRKGILRFMGTTEFAEGMWYGVELDKPVGKNDGCVAGIRYFTCPSNHGIFAPLNRIIKLADKRMIDNQHLIQSNDACLSEFSKLPTNYKNGNAQKTLNSGMLASAHENFQASSKSNSFAFNLDNDTSTMSMALTASNAKSRKNKSHANDFVLKLGLQVLCNNEIGFIRFMGKTTFSSGIWLGVELRTARGKNDGSVMGERYFSCKPNYGIMVRPSRVSFRGVNGSQLIPAELAPFDKIES